MNESLNLVKYFFETGKYSEGLSVLPDVEGQTPSLTELEHMMEFGSWSLHASDNTMTWSAGMTSILGYAKEDLPEKIPFEFYLSHVRSDESDILATLADLAIRNGENFEFEYHLRTRSGAERMVVTRARTSRGKLGEIAALVGITRDVTQIRSSQKAQEKCVQALERSNKDLEEFVYVASHDLQEPLRKVVMFSERLKDKLKGAVDPDAELFLQRIESASINMRTLIENLLTFSRANRSTGNFAPVDVNQVIREVTRELQPKIDESQATITVPKDLPVIDGIGSELRQLFINLMSNAIKFRKADVQPAIELTCSVLSDNEQNELSLTGNGRYFRFALADHGIGFENQYAEKIFQVFQRLNGKAEYPGSGIGLAICKKITANHNGIIFARGVPDEGSTFTVILPEKH